jgi:hypothetical protein
MSLHLLLQAMVMCSAQELLTDLHWPPAHPSLPPAHECGPLASGQHACRGQRGSKATLVLVSTYDHLASES